LGSTIGRRQVDARVTEAASFIRRLNTNAFKDVRTWTGSHLQLAILSRWATADAERRTAVGIQFHVARRRLSAFTSGDLASQRATFHGDGSAIIHLSAHLERDCGTRGVAGAAARTAYTAIWIRVIAVAAAEALPEAISAKVDGDRIVRRVAQAIRRVYAAGGVIAIAAADALAEALSAHLDRILMVLRVTSGSAGIEPT